MLILHKAEKLYLAAIFLTFVFFGCTPDYGNLPTSPKTLPPTILVYLNTAADSQYVILRSALTLEGKQPGGEGQRLRQSKVTLEGDGEPFVFHDHYEQRRYYDIYRSFIFVSAHAVRPGETYKLRVEIPEKGVFMASTTAPGDFQIITPNAIDTVDVFRPITVRWTMAAGAAGYRVTVWRFVIDSTSFKPGNSNSVIKGWGKQAWYFDQSESPVAVINHDLGVYYRLPAHIHITLQEAALSIEALDSPAWVARDINRPGPLNEDEFRLESVAYSNIAGGRGIMTATTTKTIPLRIPPNKK